MFLRTLAGRKGNHESALNECYPAKEQANRANNYGSSILWNILPGISSFPSISYRSRVMAVNDAKMISACGTWLSRSFPFLSLFPSFSFLLAIRREEWRKEKDEGRRVGEEVEAQRRPVESDVYRVAGFSPLITAISNPSLHQSRKH